jgi:GWxTD domain-containing protein
MWREGPVRYIITKEEDRTYKALKTEQERASFIDIFWKRRDPSPRTEINEFKERFRNRALDANQLYAETAAPGWKSDMGKVYILVGPPDEMVRDRVPRSNRGTVMWIYRSPPFPDLPGNTVIAFAKNATGEFVLSTRPTWDSDVAHGLSLMGPKATDPEFNLPMINGKDPLLLSQGVPYSQGEFETRFIYGRMQQLPPKEEAILHDVVTARSTFDAFPFKSRYSFFKTASENTLVTVTLAIRTTSVQYRNILGKESPDLELFGKFVDQDHPENQVSISSGELFAPAPQNEKAGIDDFLLFQAVVPLKPGRYLAVFAAEDKVASKVGTFREPLVVPPMTQAEKLMLSSITLAQSLESEAQAEGEKPSPFRFGSLKVVQAGQGAFRTTDSLNCYYQIYNAKKDDSGAASLDIDYEYFATRDGKEISLGKIHVGPTPSQVQAYSLPLERFPKGEYKLRVEVVDRLAGIKASEETSFSVAP